MRNQFILEKIHDQIFVAINVESYANIVIYIQIITYGNVHY